MKIRLKTRHVYRENVLIADSPEADALFQLLYPRQSLKPSELPLLGKMGFDIEIIGDTRELGHEMISNGMPYTKESGDIKITRN